MIATDGLVAVRVPSMSTQLAFSLGCTSFVSRARMARMASDIHCQANHRLRGARGA